MVWPRIQKGKEKLIWVVALILLAAFGAWAFVSARQVHVVRTHGEGDGTSYTIDCTIFNPESSTVNISAVSTITHESPNQKHALVSYPPISRDMTLEPGETKTVEFTHPCSTPSHRVVHSVRIERRDE